MDADCFNAILQTTDPGIIDDARSAAEEYRPLYDGSPYPALPYDGLLIED